MATSATSTSAASAASAVSAGSPARCTHDGIEAANANLMGQVALSWDDEVTSRDAIVETLRRGGFPELQHV